MKQPRTWSTENCKLIQQHSNWIRKFCYGVREGSCKTSCKEFLRGVPAGVSSIGFLLWNPVTPELWNLGVLKLWKPATLDCWSLATLEPCHLRILQPWSSRTQQLSTLCKSGTWVLPAPGSPCALGTLKLFLKLGIVGSSQYGSLGRILEPGHLSFGTTRP